MNAAAAPLTPTERFANLIEGLMQDAAGDAPTGWLPIPLLRLLWRRLRQLNFRFFSVLDRVRAGALPKPATPPPPAAAPRTQSSTPRPPSLPQRIGWAFRKLSYAHARRDELEDLLEDPEFEKIVADAPQLGRTLRPLCRMLGVSLPAWLRLPERPRAPKPPRPRPIIVRLGAGDLWREGDKFWPSREEARKYDAKIKVWPDEL